MRICSIAIAFLVGSGSAAGQCTLSVSGHFGHSCSTLTFPAINGGATIFIDNGTPPYDISVLTPSGALVEQTSFNDEVLMSTPGPGSVTYPYQLDNFGIGSVSVTDAMGCTASSAIWDGGINYDIVTNSSLVTTTTIDCTNGLMDVVLTDNPQVGGVQLQALSHLNYALTKDGVLVTQAPASSILLTNPLRLVLNDLASGAYHFSLSQDGSDCNPFYCLVDVHMNWTVPTPGDCGVNFRMWALLGGAFITGGSMSDALRTWGLLPTAQPYTALGYNFVGSPTNVTISPALLAISGPTAVVDWMVVELRNATTPQTVVYSKPVVIRKNGTLIDTDGNDYLNFPVPAGNYHVALRHRNHLGVMTGTPRTFGLDASTQLIDMRSGSTATYGTNARRQMTGGHWCLWPGEATGDGLVKYAGSANDRDPILTAIGGTVPTATISGQYRRDDLNLDGSVKYAGAANDRDVILQTVGGTVPTATRAQQLP